MQRISRKLVDEALLQANRAISKLNRIPDAELFARLDQCFPNLMVKATREEAIVMVAKDILFRSFDHLTDTYLLPRKETTIP